MNNDKKFEHEIDPDLLAEIEEWEKTDHDEPAEYYFSNPDPYLKPQPLPPDHPRHNCYFNEDGHLCVKNLSAFCLSSKVAGWKKRRCDVPPLRVTCSCQYGVDTKLRFSL